MRVLVTCSRTWRDASVIWRMLAGGLRGATAVDPLIVVHGDASEGDLAFIDRCAKPSCQREQPHGSHGATHCADLAEAAGIPTQRIWGWPQ